MYTAMYHIQSFGDWPAVRLKRKMTGDKPDLNDPVVEIRFTQDHFGVVRVWNEETYLKDFENFYDLVVYPGANDDSISADTFDIVVEAYINILSVAQQEAKDSALLRASKINWEINP